MRLPRPVALAATSALAAGALAAPVLAPSPFATSVATYLPGSGVGAGFDDPSRALGGPVGGGLFAGSLDVVTLGVGGSLTLGFDVPIADGKGEDFVVFENAFQLNEVGPPTTFAEVAFVEVSSGGPFARFPVETEGVDTPIGPFATTFWGAYDGLVGAIPTIANVHTNTLDPRDATYGGGTAFDLADLASDPLVLSGQVDLDAITLVRIVDLEAGTVTDASGHLIHDSGGASGSADIDGIAVVNHAENLSPRQPLVDLWQDQQGYLRLVIHDAEGLADLDPATLHISYALKPLTLEWLLGAGLAQIESLTADTIDLRLAVLLPYPFVFAASIKDQAGRLCVDQLVVQ